MLRSVLLGSGRLPTISSNKASGAALKSVNNTPRPATKPYLSLSRKQALTRGTRAHFDFVNPQGAIYGREISLILMHNRYLPDPAAPEPNELFVRDQAFFALEGCLLAVVGGEALSCAGSAPRDADVVRAIESLHGWDPGLGTHREFSESSDQGCNSVRLLRTGNGQSIPERAARETK
jgi:hypothetical protein